LEQNKVNVYTEDFHCFGQFQQLKAGHPTPEEIEDSAEFALRVTGKKVLN
jgi:hypothetical protein